jgi:hypothetical protein
MRAGVAQGGLVSTLLFSLYANGIPTSSRHVNIAKYADDTALGATYRSLSLLVCYLEANLCRLGLWLRDWRIAINVSKSSAVLSGKDARRIQKSRTVQFLGMPIQWVGTAGYLGVTLNTQFSWSSHVNQVGKAACPSERLLLYKQFIRHMMDSADLSHVRKLQVLKSKCHSIATNAPWYVVYSQIYEYFGIPFFAYYI